MKSVEYKADYVIFSFLAGHFYEDPVVKRVKSRTVEGLKIPKRCEWFLFFEQTEYMTKNGELLSGKPKNYSGAYYPGGRVMTLQEVKRDYPDKKILILNLADLGWKKIVKTRNRDFREFTLEDKIV